MHFNTTASTIALVALLGQVATAAYTVTLYPKSGCKYSNVITRSGAYRCNNIGANQCCTDGKSYQSAKFKEEGTSSSAGCDDELKVYEAMGGEACSLPTAQGAHGSCVASGAAIAGAKVVVVINPGGGSGRSSRRSAAPPPAAVAPSQYVFENGTETHVLDLDSEHGRALQLLARDEDKVDYVLQHGTIELTDSGLQRRACGGAARPAPRPAVGRPAAKPAAKPAANNKGRQ